MNSPSRWIVLSAGALVGLAVVAGSASACHPCQTTSTYYQTVTVAAYGPTTCCSPATTTAVVPVTVTTTRCGLFGLRRRTTVSYGAPVPVVNPGPVVAPPGPVFVPPPGTNP
jgi:hypothetical protein